jgi:hypothetical protein
MMRNSELLNHSSEMKKRVSIKRNAEREEGDPEMFIWKPRVSNTKILHLFWNH